MTGLLHHTPAQILQQLLIDLGVATDVSDDEAWPVYFGLQPETPDDSICTYDTTGVLGGRDQISGEMQEHYGVQIRVRSEGVNDGVIKALELCSQLDTNVKRESVVLGASYYLVWAVTRTSTINSLGTDGTSRRRLWTINALMSITPV
jgi:hypothetical protein